MHVYKRILVRFSFSLQRRCATIVAKKQIIFICAAHADLILESEHSCHCPLLFAGDIFTWIFRKVIPHHLQH
jgi:hypothetical protein